MLNLSRMEICRLFKAKSTYVILLAIIVVYIAFALLLNYNLGLVKEQENTPQESRTHTQNADSIVEISADYSALADLDKEDLGESFIISEFAQGGTLVFLIVFAALFFTAPYQNGYIRNFIGSYRRRVPFIIAEMITAALYAILAFIVSFLVLAGGCTLIGEGKFHLQDVAGVLKLLAVHFYAHMSCLAIVLFIATATRSLAVTLIVPLLYTTLFHKFICGALTTVLDKVFTLPADFHVANYTILGNINLLEWSADGTVIRQALIVTTITLILALVCSGLALEKKDV